MALALLLYSPPALLLHQVYIKSLPRPKDCSRDAGFSYPSCLPAPGRTGLETLLLLVPALLLLQLSVSLHKDGASDAACLSFQLLAHHWKVARNAGVLASG